MRKFYALSKNIFFRVFLVLLILALPLSMISNFIFGEEFLGSNVVAKVGSKKIRINEFNQELNHQYRILSQRNQDLGEYLSSKNFQYDVLYKLVNAKLLDVNSQELGIFADSELVMAQIVKNPAFAGADGKFSRQLFTQLVKQRLNKSEKQYLKELEQNKSNELVLNSLALSAISNQNEAKILNRLNKERRLVEIFEISQAHLPPIPKANRAQLVEFFEQNKQQFVTPELRQVQYVEFDVNKLKPKTSVSKEEIEQEYQQNKELYGQVETRDFYALSFSDENEAKQAYEQIEKQKNPAKIKAKILEIAKKRDQKAEDILMSKIDKSRMQPNLSEKIFALEEGQNSEIVAGPFGSYIFYLLKINPAINKSLAQVKKEIAAKLKEQKHYEFISDFLDNIRNELSRADSFKELTNSLGLKIKSSAKFDAQGNDATGRKIREFKKENFILNTFALQQDDISLMTPYGEGQYYILSVNSITPERQRSLDEVLGKVMSAWQDTQKSEKLAQLAEKLTQDLENNISKAAKFKKPNKILKRSGNKNYEQDFVNEIFSLKKGQISKAYQNKAGKYQIARLKRKINNKKETKKELALVSKQIKQDFAQDLLDQYNQFLSGKYSVRLNTKAIER